MRTYNKKLFLIALHAKNLDQVLEESAKVLIPDGAHGVILVNNGGWVSSRDTAPTLFSMALKVKDLHLDFLVGVNSLDLSNANAMTYIPSSLDILWTDKGGISESNGNAFLDPKVKELLLDFKPQYFGSEWFKYQEEPKDHKSVMCEAAKYFHTVVTSGPGTGEFPDPAKIRQISNWIRPMKRLAIASGMDPYNIVEFLPFADTFIVATGVCRGKGKGDDFFHYDPEKVSRFRNEIDLFEEEVKQLLELEKKFDLLSIEEGQSPAVSDMNLHKALKTKLNFR